MNRRQARTLLSLYAVDVFLEAHKDKLPVATSTGMCERFGRTLAELELHVRTQAAAPLVAEGLTRAKDAMRGALLRDHLAPIARIARLESARYPALAAVKMPRGEPGVAKLLAHAAGMASVAREYEGAFISAGLRPTFVEELESAIAEIEATLAVRSDRRGLRAGATRGLRTSIAACAKYKAVLHAFIERDARGDAQLLGYWRSIKQVGRPGSRSGKRAASDRAPSARRRDNRVNLGPIVDPNRLLAAPRLFQPRDEMRLTAESANRTGGYM
jgi:hypothetical protein